MTRSTALAVVTLLSVVRVAPASAGLMFNFTEGAELAALAVSNPALRDNIVNGFTEAGALWSDFLVDDIQVNVSINFESLGQNAQGATILGGASNQFVAAPYSLVANALAADATSADDAIAVANLQTGPTLTFISDARDGTDFISAPDDAAAGTLGISRANARALGLLAATDSINDGDITFSSDVLFDFDRTDGITGFDFVGVAAHELGHILGFTSGVDVVDVFTGAGPGATTDLNDPPPPGAPVPGIGELSDFAIASTLDLFRFSEDSLNNATQPETGALIDLRPGGSPFLSIDPGETVLAPLSNGAFNGSGDQASHFLDGLGIGILDPTFGPGELGVITAFDVQAFDIIGFDLAATAAATVPEPAHWAICALVVVAGLRRRRRNMPTHNVAGLE